MKDAILAKLNVLLADVPFKKEAEVVYLLVQVRKYLEQDKELGATLSTLSFYCDWVLHRELDRRAAQNSYRRSIHA